MENTNDDNEEDDSGGSDDDKPTLQVCCQDWTGRCLFVCLFYFFFFTLQYCIGFAIHCFIMVADTYKVEQKCYHWVFWSMQVLKFANVINR